MQHFHDLEKIKLEQSWVTIGSFDGVHIGHQQIIHALVEGAHKAGLPAAVITFHPHPQLVINEESRPYYLTRPEKRAQLLGDLGVDFVLTYPFSLETSRMSAREFITQLHDGFQFSELWIGYDFALGKDREGTPTLLREIGLEFEFKVHEITPFSLDGKLVSSSRIRKNIREGEIKEAGKLLGRPFEIAGKVVQGENRGKSLGFPTSNLEVPLEMIDIKPGVYVCKAIVKDQIWSAVTNIGFRPTFNEGLEFPRIEAHLLDFSGELYGEDLNLIFIDRLRDERKFSTVGELTDQINKDIELTRRIFAR